MQRHRHPRRGGVACVLLCLGLGLGAHAAAPSPGATTESPSTATLSAPAAATPTGSAPSGGAAPSSGTVATESTEGLVVPRYRSALDGYGRYRADEPLRDWREVNDEMGRLGGHGGHLQGGERKGAAQ